MDRAGDGWHGGRRVSGPERLRVYQLAQDLAEAIDPLVRGRFIGRSLADQLARAAESVIFNIAEGAQHFSPGKKIYHYQLARGSAGECIAALTRLGRRHPSAAIAAARRSANMICVMLTSLIHAQENRKDP